MEFNGKFLVSKRGKVSIPRTVEADIEALMAVDMALLLHVCNLVKIMTK